jgi:O-antigen/teichoic acid export membrane protein
MLEVKNYITNQQNEKEGKGHQHPKRTKNINEENQKFDLEFESKNENGMSYVGIHRRLNLTRVTSLINTIVSAIIQLILIRLISDRFGSEGFSVTTASLTLLSLIPFFDLGLVLYFQTNSPLLIVKKNDADLKKLLSNITATLAAISACIIVAMLATLFAVGDRIQLPASGSLSKSSFPALAYVCVISAIGLPLLVQIASLNARQNGYINDLISISAKLTVVPLTLYLMNNKISIEWLCATMALPPTLAGLFALIVTACCLKQSLPSPRCVKLGEVKRIISRSWKLNIVQISSFAVAAADPLIIAIFCGTREQSSFAASSKIVALCAVPFMVFSQPLTAAYNVAYSRGDEQWVKSTYRKTLTLFFVIIIFAYAAISSLLPVFVSLLSPVVVLSTSERFVYSGLLPYLAINSVVSGIALSVKHTSLLFRFYVPACIFLTSAKTVLLLLGYAPIVTTALFLVLMPIMFFLPVHYEISKT